MEQTRGTIHLDGRKAAVPTLSVPPADGQITLRMNVAGMIKEPEFPTHPVEVFVNDQKIANWEVGNTAPFSAQVPQEVTKADGVLTITFKMPKAVSERAKTCAFSGSASSISSSIKASSEHSSPRSARRARAHSNLL